MADDQLDPRVRTARALDLRRIIGGVLGLYGIVLVIAGIAASQAAKDKAAGINVNLWTGLALVIASALFFFWSFTRPVTARDLGLDDDAGAGGRPDG
jgi:drug/metabolite transporter (DMT)-like permease